MTIRLEFNRIAPGVEIGPHRHGVETVLYLAGGELVFEHGEGMGRRAYVRTGDVRGHPLLGMRDARHRDDESEQRADEQQQRAMTKEAAAF